MLMRRKKVFINCPFDKEYRLLLNSLLFTILYLGAEPSISETKSSSDIRINKIKELIAEADYGIHDLSRCRLKKISELPRFNMPFELGLDIGSLEYGNRKQKQKKILILEREKYFYQKVLSDISGQDIRNHNDKPIELIEIIRDWFSTLNEKKKYDSPTKIWNAFNKFNKDFLKRSKEDGYRKDRIMKLPLSSYISSAKKWISQFRINKK